MCERCVVRLIGEHTAFAWPEDWALLESRGYIEARAKKGKPYVRVSIKSKVTTRGASALILGLDDGRGNRVGYADRNSLNLCRKNLLLMVPGLWAAMRRLGRSGLLQVYRRGRTWIAELNVGDATLMVARRELYCHALQELRRARFERRNFAVDEVKRLNEGRAFAEVENDTVRSS